MGPGIAHRSTEQLRACTSLPVFWSGAAQAPAEFAVIAASGTLSILVHSSTDVPVARWLARRADQHVVGG